MHVHVHYSKCAVRNYIHVRSVCVTVVVCFCNQSPFMSTCTCKLLQCLCGPNCLMRRFLIQVWLRLVINRTVELFVHHNVLYCLFPWLAYGGVLFLCCYIHVGDCIACTGILTMCLSTCSSFKENCLVCGTCRCRPRVSLWCYRTFRLESDPY